MDRCGEVAFLGFVGQVPSVPLPVLATTNDRHVGVQSIFAFGCSVALPTNPNAVHEINLLGKQGGFAMDILVWEHEVADVALQFQIREHRVVGECNRKVGLQRGHCPNT